MRLIAEKGKSFIAQKTSICIAQSVHAFFAFGANKYLMPPLPPGHAFVIDYQGFYVLDFEGNYVIAKTE